LLEGVTSDSLIVGLRRSVKAIEKNEVERAVVATDIAPEIFDAFTEMCADFGVPVETVSSKAALGKACHIDVDASVVVVRKQK
jgi:ribosomal protein L7Ae-like RNA K-turn-binding protein